MADKLSKELYYEVNKGGKREYVLASKVEADPVLSKMITVASGRYRKVLGAFNVFRQDTKSRDAYFNS
jgi:hypothetical protein